MFSNLEGINWEFKNSIHIILKFKNFKLSGWFRFPFPFVDFDFDFDIVFIFLFVYRWLVHITSWLKWCCWRKKLRKPTRKLHFFYLRSTGGIMTLGSWKNDLRKLEEMIRKKKHQVSNKFEFQRLFMSWFCFSFV